MPRSGILEHGNIFARRSSVIPAPAYRVPAHHVRKAMQALEEEEVSSRAPAAVRKSIISLNIFL